MEALEIIKNVSEPYLRILEEPQNKFRFRYKSELRATHGCLLGINSPAESRTYPTVELFNYNKRALIRCRLVQHQNSDEHPHRLQVDGEADVGKEVPESDSYRVSFRGMTIVHTARKDVADILYQQYNNENPVIDNELWNDCWKKAKDINQNIVRLRFSAHDVETGREICEPVFSEPIHNKKSVATNALKICRLSKLGGQPEGGEEVIMFVEKVSSSDIEVHFVERNHHAGQERWFAKAEFSKDDVHHQYAIAFKTPPYRYKQIFTDVKVSVMLFRPSDESYSEPIQFSYYADPFAKQAKRKAPSQSCSTSVSIESVGSHIPDGSVGSPGSSTMDAEESLNTQTNVQSDMAPELQHSESSIQDLEKFLAEIQTEGSTGDFVSSVDAEGPLETLFNGQGDNTADLESHQTESAIQDFDKLWDIHDFTSAMVDLYNMEQVLEDALQKDSGFGAMKATEPLAPRDPYVISEPKVEHQSADEREDTCQLEASDSLESRLSRAERFSATHISYQIYVRIDGDTVVPPDQEVTSQGDLPDASDSLERTLSRAERFSATNISDQMYVRIDGDTVVPPDQEDTSRGDLPDASDSLERTLSRAERFFATNISDQMYVRIDGDTVVPPDQEDTSRGDLPDASDSLESSLSRAERFSAMNITHQMYVRIDGDTLVPPDQEDTSRGDLPDASDSLECTLSSAERSFGVNISNDKVRIGLSIVPPDQKYPCRGDASDSSDIVEGSETPFLRAKRFFAMYISEKMYKSENILILLFLCVSFIVAVCVY